MSKQYCFKINNPSNFDFDVPDLKNFVISLYVGRKKNQFNKDEDVMFGALYIPEENNICLVMSSAGKKNIEKLENINDKLTKKDLKWVGGISIDKPYEFDAEVAEWFEEKNKPIIDGKRWESLEHNGPYFENLEEPYKPLKSVVVYEGKRYLLTPKEEKVARLYVNRVISEKSGNNVEPVTNTKIFINNFWNDFKTYLTSEHKMIFKTFSKIKWGDLTKKVEAYNAKNKDLTKFEKFKKKIHNEELKRKYGFAKLDGKLEKVGNFRVEPQSIFYGRGKNPNIGKIKKVILPEDVTINIGKNDVVPKPPSGHKWGGVLHDQKGVWLAKWKDTITGKDKYVMFGAEGRFKGEADLVKYEKARKLQLHIESIRKRYMEDAKSRSKIKMQLGTVLYLIDHHGVRVGGEKKEDETDTVGASTLRVDHIRLKGPDHVIFDFLGKDSIRFYKDFQVPNVIFDNFKKLMENKTKNEQLFHSISARSINIYLKEFDKSFSAKVFRTRLASKIMYDAIKIVKIPKKSSKSRIKTLFNKANAKVADVLNHTRNVSKKAQDSVKKEKEKLKELKKELVKKKKEGKNTKSLENRIESAKNRIESKTDVLKIAISTSLANYIDPRIVVSWSKSQNVDITAIYTKALINKFNWAITTTDKNWDWEVSQLISNPKLDPLEGGDTAIIISEEDKPVKKSPIRKNRKVATAKKSPIRKNRKVATAKKPLLKIVGPGKKQDYELVLEICKNIKDKKYDLVKIPKPVLDWIYVFSKYASLKGINVKTNKYITRFYEHKFLN